MAIIIALITAFSPFALALLLAHSLRKTINPSILPKSFVRRQLLYAFLLLPLIDLFARVWLLQPFVPIFALLSVAVTGVSASFLWLLRKLVLMANQTTSLTASLSQVADYTANEMLSPQLKQNWNNLTHSIEALFVNLNYTQLSEDFTAYWTEYQKVHGTKTAEDGFVLFTGMLNNVTKNPLVREASTNLSSIVNDSVHSVQFSDFVSNGDSVQQDALVFDQIKENLVLIINRLTFDDMVSVDSFGEMTSELTSYWKIIQEGTKSLRTSLELRTPDLVSKSNLTEDARETFDEILHVISGEHSAADAFRSLFLTPSSAGKGTFPMYQMDDAYGFLPISPRWIVAITVLALMSMPVMYIGRALLQTWLQWNLSKTYRDHGSETERTIDGYILTGGITGIGFGAAQASVHALLWELVPFSTQAKLVLLIHAAMLMVVNCVIQMGISGAEGRRDLIHQWNGRATWWILATIVHLAAGAWWTAQYVGTLVCAALGLDIVLGVLPVGDAMVLALFAWWAKSICRRARIDELNHLKRE